MQGATLLLKGSISGQEPFSNRLLLLMTMTMTMARKLCFVLPGLQPSQQGSGVTSHEAAQGALLCSYAVSQERREGAGP